MPITGAIFDCDGTLVDSMPMWRRLPEELLARYGAHMTQEVFDATEPLDIDQECRWFHDNLGVGESGEALWRELAEMVAHDYATVVRPWDGVGRFLDELAGAGIPMVIASSTTSDLVRIALRAHGLEGYFADVIFTGDVGRNKDFPDVYLHAREVLGTERGTTWVFEDAPFGVRVAREAGFPVVCVMNDHDGRDEALCRQWATLLTHGYDGLTLERIQAL